MLYRSLFFILTILSFSSHALELELTQGINAALPIAVTDFQSSDNGENLAEVIAHDLNLSGQFRLVSSPSENRGLSDIPAFRRMGAEAVVKGQVRPLDNGKYEVHFQLVDAVNQGQDLLNQKFTVNSSQFRRLAHHISDEIYQKLTGEKGVFSTRIAYVLVQDLGKGQKRFSLEVADADGYNPHSLLISSEPLMSPAWSPDGKRIAYVSFEKKRAQIYIVAIESGKRQLITSFPGINGAPAWSPDGSKLAVVLSKSGSPNIYEVDLSNGRMKQLTDSYAIDTEPRYSPDGKSLIFTSGRGGSPQIYQLSFANGKVQRVSFDGSYNARASYTPDQKNIVMLHREDRGFNIAIQSLSNASVRTLTASTLAESPALAPNGRLVLYATHANNQGVLGMVSIDGRIHLRLPAREGNVQEPAWSPFA